MIKSIVITSINYPTNAVVKWSKMKDYNLIIVGDKKSPTDYKINDATFLSINIQHELYPKLAELLPENHYTRKLIGYLLASNKFNSDIIFDTDDDNEPLGNWTDGIFLKYYKIVSSNNSNWVNIYKNFTDFNIWPRGYPVELSKNLKGETLEKKINKVDISQGLVQGDPDVDAIFRLNNHIKEFSFNDGNNLYLDRIKTYSPTNSQNTTFVKMFFPLLYLPSTVTFRYTDILRGYVILALLEKWDIKLGFRNADAFQLRNEHSLISDLNSEIPVYNDALSIVSKIKKHLNNQNGQTISEDLEIIYKFLYKINVVEEIEIKILKEWLKCIN